MRYEDFLKNIRIYSTKKGKGKGVYCNLALYMSSTGLSKDCITFKSLDKEGKTEKFGDQSISVPIDNQLNAAKLMKDIIAKTYLEAKEQGRKIRQ